MRSNRKSTLDKVNVVYNMLLDGFDGKLTTTKWAKIGKCSQDTALRDIQDLIDKQILIKLSGGGRSTGYDLLKEKDAKIENFTAQVFSE